MIGQHLSGVVIAFGVSKARSIFARNPVFVFESAIAQTKWERWRFDAGRPLLGEEAKADDWFYPLAIRWSGKRVVIASVGRRVAEEVERRLFDARPAPAHRRVVVRVDRFVKDVAKQPGSYSLTFVHGRVAAHGENLRSISFYGEDLGEAELFRRALEGVTCVTVGVKQAASRKEVLRLGNEGSISFFFSSESSLREVEDALGYFSKSQYLMDSGEGDPIQPEGEDNDFDHHGG